MTRVILTLVSILLLTSCARTSKPDTEITDRGYTIVFDDTWYVIVETSFEDAWQTALFALEDLEWPVDTEMETSGLITTEVVSIGTNRDKYACRELLETNTRVDAMRCKLIVHVDPIDGSGVRVRVGADIEGRYIYGTTSGERVGGWWQCVSTGEIEGEFFDALLTRLEPIRYDRRVYRQGM